MSYKGEMDIEVRPIGFTEIDAFMRVDHNAFGHHPTAQDLNDDRLVLEVERALGAFDGARIVGSAGAHSFELTVPGYGRVPAAGVSWVGVLPTHRRRGILRALMARQLDDVADRGEPLAILTASEAGIYGRFGYGLATSVVNAEIDTARAAFLGDIEERGRLALLDAEEAADVLPQIFERYRQLTVGEVSRPPQYWAHRFLDRDDWRDGASAWFVAVYESAAGEPDGYAMYRVKENWDNAIAQNRLIVSELVAITSEARAALWDFCLHVDLVRTVEVFRAPLDEPLRYMLADNRQLRVRRVNDHLWVRPLDIPACLEARRYEIDGDMVFEVSDGFRPGNDGRYQLVGGPEGAECRRTDAEADVALDVADLGAAYLGGVSLRMLARAGRVEELTDGSLARADAMFAVDPQPFCTTGF